MRWPCRREEQKQELGHDPGVVVGDILKSQDLLKQELSQADKLVILTSAVPKMKAPPADGKRPEFYFEEDGMPEQVGAGSLPSNTLAGVVHCIAGVGDPPTMMSAVPALMTSKCRCTSQPSTGIWLLPSFWIACLFCCSLPRSLQSLQRRLSCLLWPLQTCTCFRPLAAAAACAVWLARAWRPRALLARRSGNAAAD